MTTRTCIEQLLTTSRGFRNQIILSGMMGVIHVCVTLMFVWVSKQLVDIAIGSSKGNLSLFIILMAACMLAQILLSAAENRLDDLNSVKMSNKIRHQLFLQLMSSRWTGKERYHTGDLLNRLETDTKTITDTLCRAVPATFVTIFQLITAFAFLLVLDFRLAWLLVLIMPIALVTSKSYMKRIRQLTREIRTLESSVQGLVQERLQHRILLRTLESVESSAKILAYLQIQLKKCVMKRTNYTFFSRTTVQLGFAAGYATAFLWGILGLRNGSITFGMMTAFLQLVAQVQRPVVDLSRQVAAFAQTLTSIERLSELSTLPQETEGKALKFNGNLGICLKQISFTYPDTKQKVINQFTHDFRPGSTTALIGETGAGKSTLIRLMLSLLIPDEGIVILYNEKGKYQVSSRTICNMVYVPQGNTLMSGTIRENLLLGNPNATENDINEALHIATADFVFSLPKKMDTRCGEYGMGLSEGQAHRIAIARGLLRPGRILLLDEPTASLDNDTEQILMQRLLSRLNGKTVIIVTHKKKVAAWCTEQVKIIKSIMNS